MFKALKHYFSPPPQRAWVSRDRSSLRPDYPLADEAMVALGYARERVARDKRKGHTFHRRLMREIPRAYNQYFSLAFTAGQPVGELRSILPEFLDALDYADAIHKVHAAAEMERNDLLELSSAYHLTVDAFSIAVLLGATPTQMLRIAQLSGAPGRDLFFDRLVQRFDPSRPVCATLLDPALRHYKVLIGAMDALTPEAAAQAVDKYLQGWYVKIARHSGLAGMHEVENGHIGYWSFEAAAVVAMWGIPAKLIKNQENFPAELIPEPEPDESVCRRLLEIVSNGQTNGVESPPPIARAIAIAKWFPWLADHGHMISADWKDDNSVAGDALKLAEARQAMAFSPSDLDGGFGVEASMNGLQTALADVGYVLIDVAPGTDSIRAVAVKNELLDEFLAVSMAAGIEVERWGQSAQ